MYTHHARGTEMLDREQQPNTTKAQ